MSKLLLVKGSLEYKDIIVDMLDEWSEYNRTHDTDLSPRAIFKDYTNFDEYLKRFKEEETDPKPGYVPATTYFALDTERNVMVGACQIRHYLNEKLRNGGGHIGDGVRPSERRKGFATEIIHLALEKCKQLGIKEVMMSCNKENIGSRKSIINNGGIYEKDIDDDGEILEVYWIKI